MLHADGHTNIAELLYLVVYAVDPVTGGDLFVHKLESESHVFESEEAKARAVLRDMFPIRRFSSPTQRLWCGFIF